MSSNTGKNCRDKLIKDPMYLVVALSKAARMAQVDVIQNPTIKAIAKGCVGFCRLMATTFQVHFNKYYGYSPRESTCCARLLFALNPIALFLMIISTPKIILYFLNVGLVSLLSCPYWFIRPHLSPAGRDCGNKIGRCCNVLLLLPVYFMRLWVDIILAIPLMALLHSLMPEERFHRRSIVMHTSSARASKPMHTRHTLFGSKVIVPSNTPNHTPSLSGMVYQKQDSVSPPSLHISSMSPFASTPATRTRSLFSGTTPSSRVPGMHTATSSGPTSSQPTPDYFGRHLSFFHPINPLSQHLCSRYAR